LAGFDEILIAIVEDKIRHGNVFDIVVPESMVDNHSIVVRRNDLPSLDRP
jgi:hypothetical protein